MRTSAASLWIVASLTIIAPCVARAGEQAQPAQAARRKEQIERLEQLGKTVFTRDGNVVEVNAYGVAFLGG